LPFAAAAIEGQFVSAARLIVAISCEPEPFEGHAEMAEKTSRDCPECHGLALPEYLSASVPANDRFMT